MKASKVVVTVLTSIAVGLLIGVLFAPSKGSKMRKQILDKGEGYVDAIKEELDELVEIATQKYETSRKDVKGLISSTKAKPEEVKKEIKNGIN